MLNSPPAIEIQRLHVGCGPCAAAGWVNADLHEGPGVDLACDIRRGIPRPSESFDYVVAIHVLQDLAYADIPPSLKELHRVLKPGGVLRLGLPDLDKALLAYFTGDDRYFYVPARDAEDIGAKLITQLVWYGSVRTPMTYGFIAERLAHAGFQKVRRTPFRQTMSPFPDIVAFDNRERESLFVEAVR
jgi:SAM-dependent methyltransferase